LPQSAVIFPICGYLFKNIAKLSFSFEIR